jgi:3-oxoacyl-[acyl-carrier protein] reductase
MAPLKLREQDLAGNVAVITGASRGIGRATAINLASRGCSILVTCSKFYSNSLIDSSISDEISAIYGAANQVSSLEIKGISASITSPTCAQDIANALTEYFEGRVDIFINNASDSTTGVLEI